MKEKEKKSRPNIFGFHDKYYLGNKLGKGGFGCVYSAIEANQTKGDSAGNFADVDIDLAVKIVDLRRAKGDKWQKILRNEISIWSNLDNQPNCLALNEFFENDGLNYMVMERCQSLLPYMESLDDLQERTLGGLFVQMLMGIKQLHLMSVVHGDIKPDNFFVGGANGNTVKLGDFGLAKAVQPGNKVSGECGTAPFMCPEMIANKEYDTKADVWSFGVLVYVFLFGRFPYKPKKSSSAEMKLAIKENKKKPDFGSYIPLSGSAIAFSMCLLQRDPEMRPLSSEAVQKEYMFSVLTGTHEQKELPSLRPVLRLARKVHAFENHALVRDELDEALDKLQVKHLGRSLAQTSQTAGRPSTASTCSVRRSSTYEGDMQGKSSGVPRRSHSVEMDGISHVDSRGSGGGRRNNIVDIDSKTVRLNSRPSLSTVSTRRSSRCNSARWSRFSSESSFDDDFNNEGSWICDI